MILDVFRFANGPCTLCLRDLIWLYVLTRVASLSPKESQILVSLTSLSQFQRKYPRPTAIALDNEEDIQSGRNTPQPPRPEWLLGRAANDDDQHQRHKTEKAQQ